MVKSAKISKTALIHSLSLNPFTQVPQQIFAIRGTVFTVLFKLHDIVTNQPIPCSQGKVNSMSSLRLQGLMDRIDILN